MAPLREIQPLRAAAVPKNCPPSDKGPPDFLYPSTLGRRPEDPHLFPSSFQIGSRCARLLWRNHGCRRHRLRPKVETSHPEHCLSARAPNCYFCLFVYLSVKRSPVLDGKNKQTKMAPGQRLLQDFLTAERVEGVGGGWAKLAG